MKSEIEERLAGNLERVEGLLQLYRESSGEEGQRPAAATDILRSAVVFLHATLEDQLRSALQWKWPLAEAEHFEKIAFVGGPAEKLSLPQLARHRGKSVQEVLSESIEEELAQSNFNNLGELKKALGRIGVPEAVLAPHADGLLAMMSRRHLIVHRADRNEMQGKGHTMTVPLALGTVEVWRDTVRDFGAAVLAKL